jgi:class 3 adenylate cyclase
MHCPTCGTRSSENDVICQKCGALLAISQEELERVERYRLTQNRDLLSILYIDISGFTRIANRSMLISQKLLAVHTALVTAIVERDRQGEVVNTAGDGILAVFSNPAVATELALEMQSSAYLYQQGTLAEMDDDYRTKALVTAGLSPQPAPGDEEYLIHIGINLGLVTRGGRTSRDIFGHNVNVACRLCSLADRGQIYLSEAVYDNARLILDERTDLEWKVWKDMPIRGLAAPLTIVAVAQRPYNTILPPRGSRSLFPLRWSEKKLPVMAAAAIPVILAVGLIGLAIQRNQARRPAAPAPAPVSAVNAAGTAVTQTMLPDAPPASETNVAGSAVNVTLPPPDAHPTAVPLPPLAATAVASTEIAQVDAQSIAAGTTVQLMNGPDLLPARAAAFAGRNAILVAVGVDSPVGSLAEMDLLIDGDGDNALNTRNASPGTDFLMRVAGPEGAGQPRFLAVNDGLPGEPLTITEGMEASERRNGLWTLWIFRVPFRALGAVQRTSINIGFRYRPEGPEGDTLTYPAQDGQLWKVELTATPPDE